MTVHPSAFGSFLGGERGSVAAAELTPQGNDARPNDVLGPWPEQSARPIGHLPHRQRARNLSRTTIPNSPTQRALRRAPNRGSCDWLPIPPHRSSRQRAPPDFSLDKSERDSQMYECQRRPAWLSDFLGPGYGLAKFEKFRPLDGAFMWTFRRQLSSRPGFQPPPEAGRMSIPATSRQGRPERRSLLYGRPSARAVTTARRSTAPLKIG